MLGLIHKLAQAHGQNRQQGQHADQRKQHALGQHQSHIVTHLELHQREHQEADDGGQRTGYNGRKRFAHGLGHGVFDFHPLISEFPKAFHQEDGVVHGNRELQDGRTGVGDKGYFPKDQIGSAADDDGHAYGNEKQQGLQKRRGGKDQDHKDQRHRNQKDFLNFLGAANLRFIALHRVPGHGVVLTDDGPNLAERVFCILRIHICGDQRVAILVPCVQGILIHHLHRNGHIHAVVQPGYIFNPFHLGNLPLIFQRFRNGDVL